MNARRLKNYCNFRILNSTGSSPAAAPATMTQSTGSSGASFKAARIELAPSRIAGVSLVVIHGLALCAVGLLQAEIAVKLAMGLAVFAHVVLRRRCAARRPRISTLDVEPGRGVIACNASPVAAFRVEHVFCYYLQMSIRLTDGCGCRLCIFGDRVQPEDFQHLCLCTAGYRRAGWIQANPRLKDE